jgi:hypothetical protein
LSSWIEAPMAFSPPLREKLKPGFSVQTSRVRTSRSTVVPSNATGTMYAS